MDIFESAKKLGYDILASDYALRMADATAEFNIDERAKAMLEEYKKYQADAGVAMQNPDLSKEEITKITQNLTEMAIELKKDPTIAALVFAENEFNGFVNQVMTVVKNTVMGLETKEGCAPSDCSSCSSGCK